MSRAAVARAPLALLLALVLCGRAAADDDRGEAHGDLRLFTQPVSPTFLIVVTPSVTGKVTVRPWLTFDVDWSADIVTGATPRTYGSPDIISGATSFTEVRNVIGAGASSQLGPATLRAGYAYGTENDYRSHLIRAGLTLDLLQHDTIFVLDYSHSFDSICDLDQANLPVTLRQPLDSARGCFAGTRGLTEQPLDIDAFELTWTQTLSARIIGSLSGSYQHLGGFQSNPYRRVRLDEGLVQAQESHPRHRDRGAVTGRVRYAISKLSATLGGDLRWYRDSWGVQSGTAELSWEQPFHVSNPAWRYQARARGYVQSGAVFYRDVGYSDSYERAGPVGSWFTADQELAPLADLLVGASFVHVSSYDRDKRRWRMFTNVEWRFGLDYLKLFALTPEPPNAARIRNWASALILSAAATGKF